MAAGCRWVPASRIEWCSPRGGGGGGYAARCIANPFRRAWMWARIVARCPSLAASCRPARPTSARAMAPKVRLLPQSDVMGDSRAAVYSAYGSQPSAQPSRPLCSGAQLPPQPPSSLLQMQTRTKRMCSISQQQSGSGKPLAAAAAAGRRGPAAQRQRQPLRLQHKALASGDSSSS